MATTVVPPTPAAGFPGVANDPSNGVERQRSPDDPSPSGLVGSLREWVLERGILFALLQTPLLAIIAGTPFMSVVPYPFALLPTLAAFVMLPMWIAYRKRASRNPEEPVHHLHKYALYALAPAAMFTVVRLPLYYLAGIIYWHPWYDFGNALTGAGITGLDTLFVGGVLNAIQGWSMGIGFYILFKQHSLINVLLYITVWISGLYSFTFGTYSRVGMGSPPFWHAAMAWAHFGMAITLWFMPKFGRVWPTLRTPARLAAVALGALILAAPSLFAQWKAVTWEFPLQTSIDRATFSRPDLLTLTEGPVLTQIGGDAQYQFTLRFGPRSYRNWFRQTRALDAGPIQVQARLWHDGQIIAWCTTRVERLPTPNNIIVPPEFPPAMKRMEFTDIPVTCAGPAVAARGLNGDSRVTVDWSARMTLIGYREREIKTFAGNEPMALVVKGPSSS